MAGGLAEGNEIELRFCAMENLGNRKFSKW
jgi:hypothetical protein